jgi:nucleoside-diphosphate-sugar epimerase
MRIFVAGATGVVGQRAVPLLVEAGHEVTAVARTPEKAAWLRSVGATPVSVDLFDAAAVTEAMAGHDVVINLATSIPPASRAARRSAWAGNDRIRTVASANLAGAAIATGAGRYIQESISLIYADGGDRWLAEDAPIDPLPHTRSTLAAEAAAQRVTDAGGIGVALRFGLHYGRLRHVDELARILRTGVAPAFGRDGYTPSIHIDDAATAVVAALDAPAGVYNVSDDEPVTRGEYFGALAAALDTRRPRILPRGLARLFGSLGLSLARSLRVSNRRFKEATGWAPRYPSVREGWPASVDRTEPRPGAGGRTGHRFTVRLLLVAVAAASFMVGFWAQFAPRSFYDGFPGFGRVWVSADGPYNEHLVRDVGGLNLALALLLVVAAVRLTPTLVRTAAAATLVYGFPHFLYHLAHLDYYDTVDQLLNETALGLAVAAPVAVLLLTRPTRRSFPAHSAGFERQEPAVSPR